MHNVNLNDSDNQQHGTNHHHDRLARHRRCGDGDDTEDDQQDACER